jgi:hypothetical protein
MNRQASAPVSVLNQRGASPLQVYATTCSCLQLRHREVGWGAAGGERPVRRMTNPFRPGVPASLLAKGEAWTYLVRPESQNDNIRYRGTRSVALTNKVADGKATTGEHKVVGDGMVRKVEYVKQGDLYAGKRRTGVRASIVAMKRRNGRGAKGGRKVDT